jgi:hypothetical protein
VGRSPATEREEEAEVIGIPPREQVLQIYNHSRTMREDCMKIIPSRAIAAVCLVAALGIWTALVGAQTGEAKEK